MAKKKTLKAVCDNCGTRTPLEELAPIKRLYERMDPGGKVPDGECPKCGALAYLPPDESWPQGEELLTAAEALHRYLCRADLGRLGTTMAGKLARAIDREKRKASPTVYVHVLGGMVSIGKPAGVEVEVVDFDTDGAEPGDLCDGHNCEVHKDHKHEVYKAGEASTV